MDLGTAVLIIAVLLLLGAFVPVRGNYGYGFGTGGISIPGVFLLILLIYLFFGR